MVEAEQKSAWVFYMPWSLIFLYLIYIAIGCAGIVLEYDLILYHGWLQSAIITVLLMATAIAVSRRKIALHDREQIVITLLLPITIGFQLYLLIMYLQCEAYIQLIICNIFGIISIVSMIYLFFRCRFCLPLKIIFGIISAILMGIWLLVVALMVPVSLVGAFETVFGEFGKTSVVKEVSSPNQNYVAEVVDVDEGALGGNTLVKVREAKSQLQKQEIPVLLGKLVPMAPMEWTVYEGPWGEFETMDIRWKDNHTLMIDGKEYAVD